MGDERKNNSKPEMSFPIDLVFEESRRRFYFRPFQLADDLGRFQHIVKNVWDVSKAFLVLAENQFRVNRQIKPPDEEDQLFIALDRPEQINKVAVVVVEDFFLCPWLPEENLSAAHTRFDINTMLRHHCQNRADDATLVPCIRQWAG